MYTWNIIIKRSEKDSFDVKISSSEKKLEILSTNEGNQSAILSSNIFKELKQAGLIPNSNVSDLLHLALGIYTADQVVSREKFGYQGWSRHFKVFIPVHLHEKWSSVSEPLDKLLSFLSGDKWEVFFRDSGVEETSTSQNNEKVFDIKKVALFSGGMDSFVNSINLLEEKEQIAFVSHYKRGSESSVQTLLYEKLRSHYGSDSFKEYQFYVQPNQGHKDASKESSSRARSLLFLCLGITVANYYGEDVEFIVPENGLISLNVPLTGTRLSSHSTRTTHPYYLSLFKRVLEGVGINNPMYNPHQHETKGEMMMNCKNKDLLKLLGPETLSCSHSEHSRYSGLSPGVHCGYCVPCIIRQSAEFRSKILGTSYVYNVKNNPPEQTSISGSDLRAFKLALKKFGIKDDKAIMFDILGPGPLPFLNKSELDSFIEVYKRGMKEVRSFLK